MASFVVYSTIDPTRSGHSLCIAPLVLLELVFCRSNLFHAGNTMYMEPEPVVQLNNLEMRLAREEQEEEERILSVLSRLVSPACHFISTPADPVTRSPQHSKRCTIGLLSIMLSLTVLRLKPTPTVLSVFCTRSQPLMSPQPEGGMQLGWVPGALHFSRPMLHGQVVR